VADLEWRIGDPALRGFLSRLENPSAADQTGTGESRPADSHASVLRKPRRFVVNLFSMTFLPV